MRYYFDHWQKYPYKFPTHLNVQKDSSKSYDSQRLDINVWNIEFAAGYLIYVQTSNQNHIITIFERKFQYFLQKFHEAPNLLCYINTNIPKAAHFKRKQITLIWFIFNFQSKSDFTLEHCSNQNGFCCCWKTVLLKNRVNDVKCV